MAVQVERLLGSRPLREPIAVTPFGVDTARFAPVSPDRPGRGPLVIGTIKKLEPKYGIDTLIHAFARLRTTGDCYALAALGGRRRPNG
jgi:glycosyltransferase involved in cell wall biosynthesis